MGKLNVKHSIKGNLLFMALLLKYYWGIHYIQYNAYIVSVHVEEFWQFFYGWITITVMATERPIMPLSGQSLSSLPTLPDSYYYIIILPIFRSQIRRTIDMYFLCVCVCVYTGRAPKNEAVYLMPWNDYFHYVIVDFGVLRILITF